MGLSRIWWNSSYHCVHCGMLIEYQIIPDKWGDGESRVIIRHGIEGVMHQLAPCHPEPDRVTERTAVEIAELCDRAHALIGARGATIEEIRAAGFLSSVRPHG